MRGAWFSDGGGKLFFLLDVTQDLSACRFQVIYMQSAVSRKSALCQSSGLRINANPARIEQWGGCSVWLRMSNPRRPWKVISCNLRTRVFRAKGVLVIVAWSCFCQGANRLYFVDRVVNHFKYNTFKVLSCQLRNPIDCLCWRKTLIRLPFQIVEQITVGWIRDSVGDEMIPWSVL